MNEQLSPQEVAGAQSRVAQILSEQTAQTQPAQPAQAVPSPNKTRKPTRRRTGTPNQAASAADANSRTTSITLPKEVYDWYEQQAAAAPFEPSVQRYLAWQLREEWKKQTTAELVQG